MEKRLPILLLFCLLIGRNDASEVTRNHCQQFMARLRHSTLVYRSGACNTNICRTIKLLETWEPNFDLNQVKVLILYPKPNGEIFPLHNPKNAWIFHVVINYDGYIIDLDYPGEPRPVSDYFENVFLDTPEKPGFFRNMMDRAVSNPTPQDNHEMTVTEVSWKDYRDHFQVEGLKKPHPNFPPRPIREFLKHYQP